MNSNSETGNSCRPELVNLKDDREPEFVDLATEATLYDADAMVSFIFSRVLLCLTNFFRV